MKKKGLILALLLSAMMVLTACAGGGSSSGQAAAGKKQPSEVLVLTVGDEKVYLDEMNYYALSLVDGMGVNDPAQMDEKYSAEYPTYDDAFKAQLLVQVRQSKILYITAKDKGLTLTEDEMKELDELVDAFYNSYDSANLERNGITRETVTKIYAELGLIRKLEQQIGDAVDITYDEYGKYEQLVFLTIELNEDGTAVTDDEGNYKKLSDAKISEAKANAEEALELWKNGEGFDNLVSKYGIKDASGVNYATTDSLKEAFKLKDGEYSDVIENDYGYTLVHIISLVDEEYTETSKAYAEETQRKDAIEYAESGYMDFFPISDDDIVKNVWNKFSFKDVMKK